LTPISWQTVADLFRTLAPAVTDTRLATHLVDFADLIVWRLEQADRPFTSEEAVLLSDPLGGAALSLARSLVDRTVEVLRADFPQMSKCDISRGTFYDGYHLQVQS